MAKITIEELSESLKNYLDSLGLTETQVQNLIDKMQKEVIGNKAELATSDKSSLVAAINELFQNANNGKELIANAIGEPLTAEDTFSAMSNGINGLLSTFKTNMMSNGITVESNDKFKHLIDKIATMVEEGSGKGIQYAEGTYRDFTEYLTTGGTTVEVPCELNFTPTLLFVKFNRISTAAGTTITNVVISNKGDNGQFYMNYGLLFGLNNITANSFSMTWSYGDNSNVSFEGVTWYAIGVGEEDTTLRDSLASILEDEGVSVVPEDKMANLITKTDTEFTNKNNKAENTRSKLAGLMKDGGYDITGKEDIDTLLGLLTASGIKLDEIKQIACGDSHTFILKTDGSIWGCGLNSDGQLGLGHNTNYSTFTKVTTNINNDVKEVACDNNYTVILKNDGSIWACGYNYYGQLGLGDTEDRNTFTKATTNINNDVKQIACGYNHNFILKNDGSVWACGYNYYGQLGLGTSGHGANSTFTQVTTNINNDVKQIACGYDHTFILKNDGSLWACGKNDKGQLGLGASDNSDHTTFVQVTTNINNDVKQIACGDNHTFILKNDGSVYSCGNNSYGGLGLNDTLEKHTFTQVTTNINNDVKEIVCDYDRTFILKNDGSIWGCGHNTTGQLGLGENNVAYIRFTKVTTNINNDVKQIACGNEHTFILKNDSSVYSCGYNNNGQLGVGDYTEREIFFTQIPKGLSY